LSDDRELHAAQPSDPVALLLLGSTFVDPPRAAGAKALASRVRAAHPRAEAVPYAWHLVTHGPGDGVAQLGTRTLGGDPARTGGLQATYEVEQAWDATAAVAEALRATTIVLRTPASLTPGALGRRRLEQFLTAHAAPGRQLAWEPSGLWDAATAGAAALELGLTLVWPPFVGGRIAPLPTLPPTQLWLLVEGVGAGQRVDAEQLDAVADWLADGACDAVLFGGAMAYAKLRRAVAHLAGG
jgi:hypothetical protein